MADEKLAVGQEVRVFDRRRHSSAPAEGYPGEVTKVGRKYGTAVYEFQWKTPWSGDVTMERRTVEFGLDDGREKDSPNAGMRVLTPAQVVLEQRRKAAEAKIRDSRQVELRPGCSLSLEQIEAIAAITAPGEEGQ